MIQKNPYAAYNNSKIQTATPAELTLLLYEGAIKFTNIAIVEANMKKDKDILEEVLGHLRTMRDTWKEVMAKTANGNNIKTKEPVA